MSYKSVGSQTGDKPRIPTLRQYLKETEGKVSELSVVSVIFKPSKYGGYTLTCDNKFRVEIAKGTPLHKAVEESLPTWHEEGTSLGVTVTDTEKVVWSLVEVEGYEATWEEAPWGYKVTEHKKSKPSPTGTKTARSTAARGGQGGA